MEKSSKSQPEATQKSKTIEGVVKANSKVILTAIVSVILTVIVMSMIDGGGKSRGSTGHFGKSVKSFSVCDIYSKDKAGKILGGDIKDDKSSFSDNVSTNGAESSCDYAAEGADENSQKRLSITVRQISDENQLKSLYEEDKKTAQARSGDKFIDEGNMFVDLYTGQGEVISGDKWVMVRVSGVNDLKAETVKDALNDVKSAL